MIYSDENLMKLISQISHQYWQSENHSHGGEHWHGGEGHGHGGGHWHEGEGHEHGENYKNGREGSNRVGYPNCPGPGCGNGCPYKGTEKCPKVAAGISGGKYDNGSKEQFLDPLNEEERRTLFALLVKLTGGKEE